MKVATTIEFIDQTGELDSLDVEFEGELKKGYNDYPHLNKEVPIKWRHRDYTDEQNNKIIDYLKVNLTEVQKIFFDTIHDQWLLE